MNKNKELAFAATEKQATKPQNNVSHQESAANNSANINYFSSVERGRVMDRYYVPLFKLSHEEGEEAMDLFMQIEHNGIPSHQPKLETIEALFQIAFDMYQHGQPVHGINHILDCCAMMGMVEAFGLKAVIAYENGDLQTAGTEYRLGAEHGNAFCQLTVACMYYTGEDCFKEDLFLAKYWFGQAADNGVEIAREFLKGMD